MNSSNDKLEYDDFVLSIWSELVESVLPQVDHDLGLAEEVARAAITQQQKKQRSRISSDTKAQIYQNAFQIAASGRKRKSLRKRSEQKRARSTGVNEVDFIGIAVGPDQEIDPRRATIGLDQMRREAIKGRRRKDRVWFLGGLVLVMFLGISFLVILLVIEGY